MSATHGANGTNEVHTGTTVTVVFSPTAGNSWVAFSAGQGQGGARTITISSSGAETVSQDLQNSGGNQTETITIAHANSITGGSTTITATASGAVATLHLIVYEILGGSLTLDQIHSANQVTTTAWDTGLCPSTTGQTGYIFAGGYTESNTNLFSGGTAGNDGNGNALVLLAGTSDSTNGDSTMTEDSIKSDNSGSQSYIPLASGVQRKATFTAPGGFNGLFGVALYQVSGGAAPAYIPWDTPHSAQHQHMVSM